jgi:hypothetical protein
LNPNPRALLKTDEAGVASVQGAPIACHQPNVLSYHWDRCSDDFLDRGNVEAFAASVTILAFAIVRFQRGGNLRHLFAERGVCAGAVSAAAIEIFARGRMKLESVVAWVCSTSSV